MEHYYKDIEGWFTFLKVYSEMVTRFPSGSHFVEVGSWKGRSAAFMAVEIINSGKNINFECIDSWNEPDVRNKLSGDDVFEIFKKSIKPVESVLSYKRLDSLEASKLYTDESLDFVFIDAAHDYVSVRNDISSWYPKIKIGGVIAGHDYHVDSVSLAVDTYFKGKELIKDRTNWIHNKTV